MNTELLTRLFSCGGDGRRRASAVRLVAVWAIAGCLGLLTLEPLAASAANECGPATPSGSVICGASAYPGGVTYQGASGLTVNLAAGTAVSNSNGSAAIDLEGTGALTLNALNASATGSGTHSTFTFSGPNFRPGIYYSVLGYSSSGPLSLVVGQVSNPTSGGTVGIGGYSNGGSVSIQATHVSMTGLSGIGINAEGASTSVSVGQIDATLRGIVAFGDAGGVNVTSSAINIIDNSPNTGIGIQAVALSGSGDITINSGTIAASGSNGVGGINAQSATVAGKTTIVSGSISAIGLGQYGIFALGPSAIDITSTGTIQTNGGPRFVNDPKSGGGFQNDPRFAAGIWVMDPTNSVSIKNQGSIVTAGDDAYGIRVETGTQITSVPDSNGQIDSKPITITSANISTSGQDADGIYVASDQSAITLISNTVKTTGSGSEGININSTGGSVTVTSTDAEVAAGNHEHAIDITNSGGAVTLTSGTTVGAIDITVLAVGDASVTSTSATSTGDVGVAVESLGKVTLASQSVVASGAGGAAIIGFGGGNVSITSGLATTSGDSQIGTGPNAGLENVANGIMAMSQNGNVTINSTTLSTKGIYAAGIYAQADLGTVSLTSGSIATTGAGSVGISVKAVGATINSTSITTAGGSFVFAGAAGPAESPLKTDFAPAGTITADGIDLLVGSGGATVNSGTISTANGSGIDVLGGSGAIKITSGTITASKSFGIFASGSSVSVTNTTRIDAGLQGIHAEAGTGGVTINSGIVNVANGGAGPVNNVYADGINATATGGLINIISADSETTGGIASAIYANNSGGGVTINSGTTKATGANASAIVGYATGGNVTITSGLASGTGNPAINAQASAGSISITSKTASSTGPAPTIYSIAIGGSTTINAGTTSATGGNAIYAYQDQAYVANRSAALNITSTNASGTAAATPTIFAYVADQSALSLTLGATSATGTGSDAVDASNVKGSTSIAVNGAVSSSSGIGVRSGAVGTSLNVSTGASIVGNTGVVFDSVGTSTGSYQINLFNNGTITGRLGTAIVASQRANVNNGGTINGSVSLSGSGSIFSNSGTLNGDLYISGPSSQVTLYTGSILTGTISASGSNGLLMLSRSLAPIGQIAGSQLSGFANVQVGGTWVLTGGANASSANWSIGTEGILSVTNDAALGSGSLTISGAIPITNSGSYYHGGELQITATTGGARPIFITPRQYTTSGGADIDVVAGATYTMNGVVTGATGTPLYVNNGGGTGWLVFGRDNRATLHSDISVYHGGIYAAVTGAFGTGTIHILDPDIGMADGVEVANDIDLQDTLVVTQDGGTGVLSGVISESVAGAGVTTDGTGTVVVTGADTYTGATTVGGGTTLALAGAGSIALSSTVVNDGVLDISAADAGTSIQSLSGSGQVALGADTLTLTNASGVFDGTISGTGGVTIAGGSETLTGISTYSGPTNVSGGVLVLSGALENSTVNIGADGALEGSGFVANLTLAPGSALSPGGSGIGQLALDTLSMVPGSVTELDVDGVDTGTGAGSYDRIVVQGSFTAGGQLVVNLRGITGAANNTYTPPVGQHFAVIQAGAGIIGSYDGLTEPASGLANGTQLDALYADTGIDLVVTPASYAGLIAVGVTETVNQVSLGGAIDSYRLAPGVRMTGDRNVVLSALYGLPAAGIGAALDQIAGSVHGDVMNAALDMNRMFASATNDHLNAHGLMASSVDRLSTGEIAAINTIASPHDAELVSTSPVWALALGSWSHTSGDGNAPGYSATAGGVLAGVDLTTNASGTSGLTVGYAKSDVSTKNAATATVQTERLTIYGDKAHGAWRFSGEMAVAVDQYSSRRLIRIGALTRTARGDANGWAFAADGGVHYDLDFAAPFVEARYDHVSRNGFTETAAGGVSLIVLRQSLDVPRFTTGVDLDLGKMARGASPTVAVNLRLAYAHDFSRIDGVTDAALSGSPFTGFTALSSRVGLDAGIATLNVAAHIDDAVSLFGEYHVESRTRQTSQAVELGLRAEW